MARILIVDDSVVVRGYIKVVLERAGHEILAEAVSGQDAYQKYTILQPDLVTMDINMPEMNGIDTVKMILDKDPKAKIIMVSTYGLRHLVFEAIKAGAKNYIVKPINEDSLLTAINKTLQPVMN
ncbi:response regulator [Brevibacillus ginsengisoli]|uniref:response regulator n=1 Tax=Brevibacillus ginsengisoli TaxID=363854 RepID=UPI003CF575D6